MSYPAIVFTDDGDAWIDAINGMTGWNVDLHPEKDTDLAATAAEDGSIFAEIVQANRDGKTCIPQIVFRRLTNNDEGEPIPGGVEFISIDDLVRVEVY